MISIRFTNEHDAREHCARHKRAYVLKLNAHAYEVRIL